MIKLIIDNKVPAPIAKQFFKAPAISTPIKSLHLYILNISFDNAFYTKTLVSGLVEATTTRVGIFLTISSAKEGPDKTE